MPISSFGKSSRRKKSVLFVKLLRMYLVSSASTPILGGAIIKMSRGLPGMYLESSILKKIGLLISLTL